MKKTAKSVIAVILCLAMIAAVTAVPVFAKENTRSASFDYKYYTYLGDSIAWGYGLDPAYEPFAAESVFVRIDGAYPDLVGKVLEENQACDTEVHSAACNGARLCDYRVLLERGMGFENPYVHPNDYFSTRSVERTEKLQGGGEYVCENLRKSDLVTVTLGANDIASSLINVASAFDCLDFERLMNLTDTKSKFDYALFAIQAALNQKHMFSDFAEALKNEVSGLRTNQKEVIKDIVTLAPDADILIVGYFVPMDRFPLIPGTDSSMLVELLGSVLTIFNDAYEAIAAQYDNVYYVDAPDASIFFKKGTPILEGLASIFTDTDAFLLGIHPDAEGQKYISEKVLDKLEEIHTCHHDHTKTVSETINGYGVSSTVCEECGEVLDSGKIVTPCGNINIPGRTISYVVDVVEKNVNNFTAKLKNSVSSLFKR